MDPFQAGVNFLLGRLKQSATAQWFKFLFELGFSAVVSFLFACGTLLFGRAPAGVAIGFGMIWSAMAMTYLFRRETSRLTKGMLVALPGDEAAKELAAGFQTIEKPDGKNEEKKS